MTDQLTICCEPLKMLMVSLWTRKTSLKSAKAILLIVLCLGVEFLCCLHLTCVFIFSKL